VVMQPANMSTSYFLEAATIKEDPKDVLPSFQMHGKADLGTLNLLGNEKIVQWIPVEHLGRKLMKNSFITFNKRRRSRPTLSCACANAQELY